MKAYLYRVGTALSVLINVIFGGKSNQTFSARNFEWFLQGDWNMVKEIDWLCCEPSHCMNKWDTWLRIEKVLEAKRKENR